MSETTTAALLPRYRPKYFHQLNPQPLELPEVLCRIHSHLSKQDIKKCMLVCSIWAKHFGPFLWDVFHFNRFLQQNDVGLQRNGHLIRHLYTYSLKDKDLAIITRDCPNLTQLDLEIASLKSARPLYNLLSRVNGIQKLKLRLVYPNHLDNVQRALLKPIALGVLRHLTELKLKGFEDRTNAPIYHTGMILRCLEGCPLIQTLELSALRLVDTIERWDVVDQNFFPTTNTGLLHVAMARPFAASTSSWFNWANRTQKPSIQQPPTTMIPAPRKSLDRTRQIIRGVDLNLPNPVEVHEDRSISPPNENYKCKYLTTLILRDLYSSASATCTLIEFAGALLMRSPNLVHLSLKAVPAEIEHLSAICPKLRILNIEIASYVPPSPYPNVIGFLNNLSAENYNIAPSPHFGSSIGATQHIRSDSFNFKGLRSLRLSQCTFGDDDLLGLPDDFKRYQLRNLELSHCDKITSLGYAQFLAQCWYLETLWVDSLLLPVKAGQSLVPRIRVIHESNSNNINNANIVKPAAMDTRGIKWECSQIRYLDVYGYVGCEESFEHIFLDMLARLDVLEFLGMSTIQIGWLMKHEPVRYITSDNDNDSSHNPKEITIPPGIFGSIKTLSLESSNRFNSYYTPFGQQHILSLEQAKYLHDAFPVLEKIVYISNIFPASVEARSWLLQTPRKIEVLHRSKEEVAKSCLGALG
ncbi:hypothetical protein BGZ76_008272 [Entomortierella beljakovae]|nr:hypothetical protein BGZ76_008272 [Entomortierella beljakovae]